MNNVHCLQKNIIAFIKPSENYTERMILSSMTNKLAAVRPIRLVSVFNSIIS